MLLEIYLEIISGVKTKYSEVASYSEIRVNEADWSQSKDMNYQTEGGTELNKQSSASTSMQWQPVFTFLITAALQGQKKTSSRKNQRPEK